MMMEANASPSPIAEPEPCFGSGRFVPQSAVDNIVAMALSTAAP